MKCADECKGKLRGKCQPCYDFEAKCEREEKLTKEKATVERVKNFIKDWGVPQ